MTAWEITTSKFHFARVVFASAITSVITSVAISITLTSAAHAQTAATAQPGSGPATRASGKADLKNLESHGYRPSATESNYPNDIQKAGKSTYGSDATKPTIGLIGVETRPTIVVNVGKKAPEDAYIDI
jgi:hypothetical protein